MLEVVLLVFLTLMQDGLNHRFVWDFYKDEYWTILKTEAFLSNDKFLSEYYISFDLKPV